MDSQIARSQGWQRWLWGLGVSVTVIAATGSITAPPAVGTPSHQLSQTVAVGNCTGVEVLRAAVCPGDELDAEETQLYQQINQYRAQYGLPPIPLAPSLNRVANRHVRDMAENLRQFTHAWSDCPYNPNQPNTYPCMWNAPQRLGTAYPGMGYESAHGGPAGYRATAASALQDWQASSHHNDMLLNRGLWQERRWQAIGLAIYQGYAVLWFGEVPDPAMSEPTIAQPPQPPSDRASFERAFREADLATAVQLVEQYRSREFTDYYGLRPPTVAISIDQISQTLNHWHRQTGKKPALSYVVSLQDRLDLILVLPNSPTAGQPYPLGRLSKALDPLQIVFPLSRKVPAAGSLVQSPPSQAVRKVLLRTDRASLQAVVTQFRQALLAGENGEPTDYLEPAQQLYQALIAPILPELTANQIQTLEISADVGLRSLPFAALHDGQQFLIERYSLTLIPSFALTDYGTATLRNQPVLAMGISQSTQGQQPLPAAAIEVENVTRGVWQGQGLLNQQATIAQVEQANRTQRFGILHLATHAHFSPGQAQQSYIQFWGERLKLNQLPSWMQALQGQNQPIQMLVLSACRTALGNEQAELGFAGVALGARVKTAIGSLWDVSDAATLGLISDFYRHLHTAPTKAEALRQAQLAMLHGKTRLEGDTLRLTRQTPIALPSDSRTLPAEFRHPYYWSAFTVIGSGY
ncbi:CHAT domain-containing protein [Trichothermofontia sichuanensis B231]|uniref:CHAT domain-containing protein n=1 Tax=Trichothermofontia sichuanensis TaxID=3045816 RepID=UPI002244FE42|nr:CHAT domain-containing protein [Trichothermofontia sichuanensis]UZQ55866.1 CHAT domain-containing protein [Trichothermofontia sichuanensis B231]